MVKISFQSAKLLSLLTSLITLASCNPGSTPATMGEITTQPATVESREIQFESFDGTLLAGQFDYPPGNPAPPLAFIIHHDGPVDRSSYQYLTDLLVPAGYATFRFDKRGTGKSEGEYGCCLNEDALAAFEAALEQGKYSSDQVFIIAQSQGTQILLNGYDQMLAVHQPAGAILLSSLLDSQEITKINIPVHIIVSDSEPNLMEISEEAVNALQAKNNLPASFEVIPNTEHTLFDISEGPIDWDDPSWPQKFHPLAWASILRWLESQTTD